MGSEDRKTKSPQIGGSPTFTIQTAGRYRISYHINVTLGLVMGTRITINGAGLIQSTVFQPLGLSSYSNEVIVNIAANDTVSLQLFNLVGAAVLLPDSVGASLMIMRLS